MRNRVIITLFAISVLMNFSVWAQPADWPVSTENSKPWTRWWWMDNAVDKENINRELHEMAKAGIGGVEITSIYGVNGEEARAIPFLSQGFADILNFTIDEAHQLGMGVDLPSGSGWRNGGPFVPEEKGLWSMKLEKTELKTGEQWKLPVDIGIVEAASFVSADKKVQILDAGKPFVATESGTVYLAIRRQNGDLVKRPSKGGEGRAIDTFNEDITNWYLAEFWEKLGISEGKVRCFFHDSFEYTGDFTTKFTSEFKKRRGYDLDEYLYVIAGDCNDKELEARVKSDYRETLADLVLESFIQPMTLWANSHKSLNRNQAHGSPGNILDLYAASDIPETEIFRTVEPGSADVFVNKFASSAAHITGKKLVSSESFTWLNEHWTVTTSDMVRATNRFFLAGINHMFFHGTCYSPADVEWPGWLFYASTQINNRNPLWPELPALFSYIARSQAILQHAKPESDLLIYWPYYDVAAMDGKLFNHIGVNHEAGWFVGHPISRISKELMNAGYTFDYISDKLLAKCKLLNGEIVTEGNAVYKAIVVPETEYIPLETLEKLLALQAQGCKVYFDGKLPEKVPGAFNFGEREKKLADLNRKIQTEKWVGNVTGKLVDNGISGEKSLAENGLYYLKMKLNDEYWYLIFNTTTGVKEAWVELQEKATAYVLYDAMTGNIRAPQLKGNQIRLQLEPEQTIFIRCASEAVQAPAYFYAEKETGPGHAVSLWRISFLNGGPAYPGNIQTDELISWTKMGDMETRRFAGTVRYQTEFHWEKDAKTALLDLGVVKDCAHVKLNGKDFGTLLGPTFTVVVDNLVQGKNTLQIDVTNVAANRIRDLDINKIEWRKFKDINFVNIDYKPFDASGWEIRDAGLLGSVQVR
ncbi:MAG: glycosyl hydrolase [Draconibacterium sp.]